MTVEPNTWTDEAIYRALDRSGERENFERAAQKQGITAAELFRRVVQTYEELKAQAA